MVNIFKKQIDKNTQYTISRKFF